MIGIRKLTAIAAASALTISTLLVAPVFATQGSGFAPSTIVTGKFGPLHTIAHKDSRWPSWDLLFKTKADTDLGVDQLTVQPGGFSGWHSHAGPIYLTVKSGEITWFDANCVPRTYKAGESFVEESHNTHFVENQTSEVTILIAVAPRPKGAPGRLDEPEPQCAKAG